MQIRNLQTKKFYDIGTWSFDRPLMTRTEFNARRLTQSWWEKVNLPLGRSPKWQCAKLAALFIKNCNNNEIIDDTFNDSGRGGGGGTLKLYYSKLARRRVIFSPIFECKTRLLYDGPTLKGSSPVRKY
jgi:hypothetical protein